MGDSRQSWVARAGSRLFASRGVRDLSWLLSGSAFTLVFGLASTILLARSTDQGELGEYFLATSWLAALAGWGLPGVSSAIITSIARREGGTFRAAVKWEFISGIGGAICLAAVGWHLSERSSVIPFWFYLAVAAIYPIYLNDCGWQVLTGQKQYRKTAFFQGLAKAANLVGVVVCVLTDAPLGYLFLWGALVLSSINLWLIRQGWNAVGDEKVVDRPTLVYGLNLTFSNVLLQPLSQAERLIVGLRFGAADLAVFGLGEMVYNYLKILGSYSHSIYFPRLALLPSREAKAYLFRQGALWTVCGLAATTVLSFVLPTVYIYLFGERYRESAFFAALYSVMFALSLPNFFITIFLRHFRATRETYLYGLIRAPLQLLLLVAGFHFFGKVGLPYSRGATVVLHAIIGLYLVSKVEMKADDPPVVPEPAASD